MPDFMRSSRWLKRYFIVERRSGARQGQHPSGAEATMDFLKSWDLGASFAMGNLHRGWLTPVMKFITHLGDDLTLIIVVGVAVVFFLAVRRWRTACCVAATWLSAYTLEKLFK